MRVWLRDEQVEECADISFDMTRFIRERHAEARRRLHLTDPKFDSEKPNNE